MKMQLVTLTRMHKERFDGYTCEACNRMFVILRGFPTDDSMIAVTAILYCPFCGEDGRERIERPKKNEREA